MPSIVTMPWGARSNYGHFVLDCLPAVVAIQALGLREHDFVFPRLTTWQRDHLQLVGLNGYRELDAPLVVSDHVVFTNAMDHYLHRPSEATLEVRHQQLSRAGPGTAPGIKLYLSRRGDGKRRFVGEATLERDLESLGFVSVDPGALSVPQQIQLFRDASVIVGPTGAAFANVLYAKPGSLVVEIQPRLLQGIWVRNLCLLGGFKHQPYFVGGVPPTSVVSVGGVSRPEIGQTFEVDSVPFLRSLENAMSGWQEI
jgi:capsular polysaccharide biosynthesis protein